ncbi:MAG: tetratricopeptide repeat protein [Alphaproteobacteria bacterium]|nr:MAG: tetratricopeptide repeat protein [Alphaproteobacteria bacterium]
MTQGGSGRLPSLKRNASFLIAAILLGACAQPGEGRLLRYSGPPAPLFAPPIPEQDPVAVGHRLMAAGEYELALRRYEEALVRDPGSVPALIGVGTANQRLGRLKRAEKFLVRAVELAPDSVAGWNNLGVVRYKLGEYKAAHAAFRTAFALDGGRSESIRRNLELARFRSPETVDIDRVASEFELVRRGDGTYLLVDRKAAPETPPEDG